MEMTKIAKSKIALIQLRRAIRLFNSKDFISAVTLAGAANEILAQMAVKKLGYNTLDGDKRFWDGMAEFLGKNKPSKGKIKQVNNRIRNSLKHHDIFDDISIEADFEFEAQCQIDSAIKNYWIAFDKPVKDRIVNSYVNWQWI
jgi:hypothetical protein